MSIALLGTIIGNSFASNVHYMGGTYQSSSEDASGCHICCSQSSLYCYVISGASVSDNPPTYFAFGQSQALANSMPASTYGTYTTVTAYDANNNVAATFSGYYYGITFDYNPDATVTSNIALTALPE